MEFLNKESLHNIRISEEDWARPLKDLPHGVTYLVGSFNKGNVVTMVSFQNYKFYLSNKSKIDVCDIYNFENLCEAYRYFEYLFYGKADM